jgi:ketosteroid isomerase-like protein
VELVREAIAAFAREDFRVAGSFVHPDVVSIRNPPLPDPQTYRGMDGVLQMYADWTAEFGDFEMEVGETAASGPHVVVELVQQAKGRASGALVEGSFWAVYTVTDGKISRQDVYIDRSQARAAAGLAP